jgi:hypothetical protein
MPPAQIEGDVDPAAIWGADSDAEQVEEAEEEEEEEAPVIDQPSGPIWWK